MEASSSDLIPFNFRKQKAFSRLTNKKKNLALKNSIPGLYEGGKKLNEIFTKLALP